MTRPSDVSSHTGWEVFLEAEVRSEREWSCLLHLLWSSQSSKPPRRIAVPESSMCCDTKGGVCSADQGKKECCHVNGGTSKINRGFKKKKKSYVNLWYYNRKVLFPKAVFEKFPVVLRLLLCPVIPFQLLLLAFGRKFCTV